MTLRRIVYASLALALAPFAGCGSSASEGGETDAQFQQAVTVGMQASVEKHLDDWLAAVQSLQASAPTPAGRGWDATADAAPIAAMKDAWRRARAAYENVEGVIAPLFPDSDVAADARFEQYEANVLHGQPDNDPFDDRGMTGMHGIERILFSDVTPPAVVAYESGQAGYWKATFPRTSNEAAEFKTKLCQKLIDDVQTVRSQWGPAKIDLGEAFQGLISLMNEQSEKVKFAAIHQEESRYAQTTMDDLRANLSGTVEVYTLFRPWLAARRDGSSGQDDGPTIDRQVEAGFAALSAQYARVKGAAIPQPPADWSSVTPSQKDLTTTAFGELFATVEHEADASSADSVVDGMNRAADVFGFPEFSAHK